MSDAPNACGTCTQCCKTMKIEADDGTVLSEYGCWCPLVEIGVGCKTYPTRPSACRTFECVWLKSQRVGTPLPPEWRPDRLKVVLVEGNTALIAHVDRHRPDAWREGPFGRWLAAVGEEVCVVAKIGDRGVTVGPKAAKILLDRVEGVPEFAGMLTKPPDDEQVRI